MRKAGLTIKHDNLKKVFSGMNLLLQADVLVGYPADGEEKQGSGPAGSNARKPEKDDPHPLTNAEIAYIMENGAPDANIPARPSLLPGVKNALPRIQALWKQYGQASLKGDLARMDRILHAIGLEAQASVRREITTGDFLALSPRTLAARRARGRTGTKPLLDTAQMRNAVSYVIRKRVIRRLSMMRVQTK